MLTINFPIKIIQSTIISVNTYKKKIIEIGNKNEKIKNRDKWNYCHDFPILTLLGDNHRLPLIHMAKCFIWLEEKSDCINEFNMGYMINPTLHVNKAFK